MNNWELIKIVARRVVRNEEGVTALEYGMIAALIAAVIIGTVKTIGTSIEAAFTSISSAI